MIETNQFVPRVGPEIHRNQWNSPLRYQVSHRSKFWGAADIPLDLRSIALWGVKGLLVGLQLSASSCSSSRMSEIFGRADGESEASNSSSHVLANNVHNASENPTEGRSGRIPPKTFWMTAASGLVRSNGLRRVTTCKVKSRSREKVAGAMSPYAVRTSRIVIPSAYISVLFEGSFLRARLTYPYFSGSNISGAIHRIVPPVLLLLAPSIESVSSMITVFPKSARQARRSELMRISAWISSSSAQPVIA